MEELLRGLDAAAAREREQAVVDEASSVAAPFRLLERGCTGTCAVVAGAPTAESVLRSSTLPFGGESLPSFLAGDPKEELSRDFLSLRAAVHDLDRKEGTPAQLLARRSWKPSIGVSMQSLGMSEARATLSRFPGPSFLVGGGWELRREDGEEASTGYGVGTMQLPSAKLSQYTRGKTGSAKPFKSGGLEKSPPEDVMASSDNEGAAKDVSPDVSPFMTDEAIAASLMVLEDKDWNEGELLSAPPGVDFRRGLTAKDIGLVAADGAGDGSGQRVMEEDRASPQQQMEVREVVEQSPFTLAPPTASTGALRISMFGDEEESEYSFSSSESEESESSGGDEGNEEIAAGSETKASKEEVGDRGSDVMVMSDDEVERAIDELLLAGSSKFPLHDAMAGHMLNRHQDRRRPRDSWAVTKPLDVSDFASLVPNPALAFPFELDTFQKQAVVRLERSECVFIAAHTSAGKTVVAEYAIALAAKHMTRAIYTSPIKALSNQKYRDFKTRFGDVGLITGDVSINPDAACLIMTTEILRSMLYRGADIIRDIEWVIFDEVHYVNDVERGVVWEEVIIMLPDHANMIFLSATTPNTEEFSDWIGRSKKKPVHVITTDTRPVPLQHHIYAAGQMFKVLDQRKNFLPAGYRAASNKLAPKDDKKAASQSGNKAGRGGGGGGFGGGNNRTRDVPGSKSQWQGLVNLLRKESLMPAVVFSFSKRKCEDCADALSNLDLTDGSGDKAAVHVVCASAIARLDADDSRLPQVLRVQELLKRGIGVHHGGMLPILKEMVEMLFSRGLVRILFATETFAMGVNMPARTVVFNGTRKHDGRNFRDLLPGEYTQMAGRAGRRGLDKVGTVILTAWGEPPPQSGLKLMLTGSATKLSSQFRLKFNMILTLLRVEDMSVEDMIKRSFSEFATQRALGARDIPRILQQATASVKRLDERAAGEPCIRGDVPAIEDYHAVTCQVGAINSSLYHAVSVSAKGSNKGLVPGRVVIVAHGSHKLVNAPAMVITSRIEQHSGSGDDVVRILVLALCSTGFILPASAGQASKESRSLLMRGDDDVPFGHTGSKKASLGSLVSGTYGSSKGRSYLVADLPLTALVSVTRTRKKCNFEALQERRDERVIGEVMQALLDIEAAMPSEPSSRLPAPDSPLAPLTLDDLKVRDLEVVEADGRLRAALEVRASIKCEGCPKLQDQFMLQAKRSHLMKRIAAARHVYSNESLSLFPDFQQRLNILRQLRYVDDSGTVKLKGRVACEVNTADELIVTELVFENVLAPLSPPEVAGLLSALVFQEKSNNVPAVTERLKTAMRNLTDIARGLGALQKAAGLPTDAEDMLKQGVNFGLVDVVYEWARGVPFAEICQITLVQEGSIVRTVTRLDELIREVRNAARVVGDPTLYRKMEAASQLIKRGVVFAASLYY